MMDRIFEALVASIIGLGFAHTFASFYRERQKRENREAPQVWSVKRVELMPNPHRRCHDCGEDLLGPVDQACDRKISADDARYHRSITAVRSSRKYWLRRRVGEVRMTKEFQAWSQQRRTLAKMDREKQAECRLRGCELGIPEFSGLQ